MESFFIILFFVLFVFFLIMTIYVYTHDEETYQQRPQPQKRTNRYSTHTPNYRNHYYHNTNNQEEDEPNNFIDNNSYLSHEYNDKFEDEEYIEYWYEEDEDERN